MQRLPAPPLKEIPLTLSRPLTLKLPLMLRPLLTRKLRLTLKLLRVNPMALQPIKAAPERNDFLG